MTITDSTRLLLDLESAVVENFERHISMAKEWMPHEYVPWSLGRDYADLGGADWDPEQSRLSAVARTALEVNLLTEDNLPSYHREIERAFGRDRAWGTWVHRWTAEEARHAYCIRDYLLVTRGVDPVELERARMEVMSTGYDSNEKPVLQGARVRIVPGARHPDLASQYRPLRRRPDRERLLARVSTDENLHMVFYRNLVTAALEVAPGPTMRAITDEVVGFEMPGAVIPGFTRKAAQIAQAGIYDLRVHHDEIWPLLRHWGVFDSRGSTPRASGPATSWPSSWPGRGPGARSRSNGNARGRGSRPATAEAGAETGPLVVGRTSTFE